MVFFFGSVFALNLSLDMRFVRDLNVFRGDVECLFSRPFINVIALFVDC